MINRQIASGGRDFWGLEGGAEVGHFAAESGSTTQVAGFPFTDACLVPLKKNSVEGSVCACERTDPRSPHAAAGGPRDPGSLAILPQALRDPWAVRKVLPE